MNKKRIAIVAAAVFVLTFGVFGIIKSGLFTSDVKKSAAEGTKSKGGTVSDSLESGSVLTGEYHEKDGSDADNRDLQAKSGGAGYGGDGIGISSSHPFIPALPMDENLNRLTNFAVSGEEITDEEAMKFFKENTWIRNSLEASGVSFTNLEIKPHGYCHVFYDGTQGKPFEIKQNFKDFLAYDGDRLVSIITLTKDGGRLSATPSFGGPWFESFNAKLSKYKGQELVFCYAGWMEFFVAPDGTYHYPQGQDLGLGFEEQKDLDLYGIFYNKLAVYVP